MSVHDDLLALCCDMHAAGERLTYAALRARHGGGSRRDIGQALREWQQRNMDCSVVARGRPSAMETRLRDIIQRQRRVIKEQAEEIGILKEDIESLARMIREE